MAEFIHEHSTRLKDEDGTAYVVRIYARERPDGTWEGWLEFHPTDERKSVLRTEQETSQPNRLAVEYWASGLEPIYLEGSHVRKDGCCEATMICISSQEAENGYRVTAHFYRIQSRAIYGRPEIPRMAKSVFERHCWKLIVKSFRAK